MLLKTNKAPLAVVSINSDIPPKNFNSGSPSLFNKAKASAKSLTPCVSPFLPKFNKAKSASLPILDNDTDKLFALASVAPAKDFSKPFNKASNILLAPLVVLANFSIPSFDKPNSVSNILNAGIPFATNWFKACKPKPPWTPLANNLVKSFNVSNWSVDAEAVSVNILNNLSVGLIPAVDKVIKEFAKSCTENVDRLVESIKKFNTCVPFSVEPATLDNIVCKSWNFLVWLTTPTIVAPVANPNIALLTLKKKKLLNY